MLKTIIKFILALAGIAVLIWVGIFLYGYFGP
jgi:hypothetical protein